MIPQLRGRRGDSFPLRETHLSSYIEAKKRQYDCRAISQGQSQYQTLRGATVFVLSAFHQKLDWADVEREAASAINKKWISNVKEKVKKDIEPHGHNFEAVVSFKEYCDKKDPFNIYRINDRGGNPDQPSFVFKTSSTKLNVALNMDCNGEHFLNSEFCFFDGKLKRCRGFVTLVDRQRVPSPFKKANTACHYGGRD